MFCGKVWVEGPKMEARGLESPGAKVVGECYS